jgi:hypothetical protein
MRSSRIHKGIWRWHKSAKIVLMLMLSVLFSCQEKIKWELTMENTVRLVVEGKITNEKSSHLVKLSLPVYEINGQPEPVSGAEVFISDSDTVYQLTEHAEQPGSYYTEPDVHGVVNRTYQLLVNVGDYQFSGLASMKGVTPFQPPDVRKVQSDPPLYELQFFGNDEPSRLKLEMDWSHLPGYDTLPDTKSHAIIYAYYFDALTVDVNEIFSSPGDRVFFPPGTIIIATKESLSDGYARYLRGLLSETSWNGGLFDVKPGDPANNLSAGAIGYFSASSVIRDTVTFWP